MPSTLSFSASQLRELRSEMENDFARVLRSMSNGHTATASSADDAWSVKRASEPDELQGVLQDRAQDRLSAISAALRRLDNGDYGVCVRCGSRISFARLLVMPEATLCVACSGN